MRLFLEKFLITMFCLYHSYSIHKTPDIVFLFLSGIMFSLFLDLAHKKQYRLAIYLAYLLLCFWHKDYVLYMPLIIYNMSLDLKGYMAMPLILLLPNISPLTLIIGFLSLYLSVSRDQYGKRLDLAILTHNSLIEDKFQLKRYTEQLEKDTQKSVHIGVLTERNRISRELHDSIGHVISSSILQVEALKVLSEEKNLSPLNMLQNTLDNGMGDIRNSIHNLYADSLDLRAKIHALGEEFPKLKVALTYQISSDLSYDLKFDILSVVKEIITNCTKHSNSNTLVLTLLEQPSFYALIAKDNGSDFTSHRECLNSGMGLFSMKEIADKYGGSFNYEFDSGFKIHMILMKG